MYNQAQRQCCYMKVEQAAKDGAWGQQVRVTITDRVKIELCDPPFGKPFYCEGSNETKAIFGVRRSLATRKRLMRQACKKMAEQAGIYYQWGLFRVEHSFGVVRVILPEMTIEARDGVEVIQKVNEALKKVEG